MRRGSVLALSSLLSLLAACSSGDSASPDDAAGGAGGAGPAAGASGGGGQGVQGGSGGAGGAGQGGSGGSGGNQGGSGGPGGSGGSGGTAQGGSSSGGSSGAGAGSGAGGGASGGAGAPAEIKPACGVDRCKGQGCESFTPTSELIASPGIAPHKAPSTVTPLPPLIDRSVRLGKEGELTQPVVPAFRTSADGRLALKQGIAALRPEVLEDAPVVEQPNGLAKSVFGASKSLAGLLPQGASTQFLCQKKQDQPFACNQSGAHDADASKNDFDCYDLVVVVSEAGPAPPLVYHSIPISVRVANPKTKNAEIVEVSATAGASAKKSPPVPFALLAEMVPTADGHLIAGRILGAGDDSTDEDPGAGADVTFRKGDGSTKLSTFSLFYAYADDPCDVSQWFSQSKQGGATVFESLRPINAAPFDPRLKDDKGVALYGLASRPMRDTQGKLLGEDDVLSGSYPWLDREGNNLVFSTNNPMPFAADGDKVIAARYPIKRHLSDVLTKVGSSPRGFSIVGSWTTGKVVTLDGLINNDDYGFRADQTHALELYRSSQGPIAALANGGGKLGVSELGLGDDVKANNHHIESHQNQYSMFLESASHAPRDVVWTVSRGLGSTEVVFDDFLDPHVLLFSEMNAAYQRTEKNPRNGVYLDGFSFDGSKGAFVHDPAEIRVQNAATSAALPIAGNGVPSGEVRIEPLALGGIYGRGLWLEGEASLKYKLPAELSDAVDAGGVAAGDGSFYAGVFVDARDELSGSRHLFSLTMRDQTARVTLDDGAVLRVDEAAFDLSCLAGSWDHAFHHLGLLFEGDGTVTAFLDGNAVGVSQRKTPLRLGSGSVVLGGPSGGSPGVRGWYDELRLVANSAHGQLTHGSSVELLCNYARGTQVAVSDASPLRPRAELAAFARSRAEALGVAMPKGNTLLFCATRYDRDLGVGRHDVPKGTTPFRDQALLEGTAALSFDKPRPDSTERPFCTTCHLPKNQDPGRPPTLTLSALTTSDKTLENDPRTQPSQPPSPGNGIALSRGRIPQGWLTATDGESYPKSPQDSPVPILRWMLR